MNRHGGHFRETGFSVSLENVLAQRRIDKDFETVTPGYRLLDISMGTTLTLGKVRLKLRVQCRNITNQTYFDHLSRYKFIGVKGMGRSVDFGIGVPFSLKNPGK